VDAETTVTRRTVLAAGLAVAGTAGVAALAGCSSKQANAAAGSGGSGVLAKVADVPVGDAVSATLDGKPILISHPSAGTIVAFTAICTHQGCTVAPAGKQFHCPCHNSVDDAATGTVISGPAPAPLAAVPVKVDGPDVVAG
jgi:cytochrome b6-f complex iron-sulfur subunit